MKILLIKNDKKVATELEIDDRMYCTAKRDTFITLKDHKRQFMNNPKFRVINPTKSELGKVSKQMQNMSEGKAFYNVSQRWEHSEQKKRNFQHL